MSVLMSVSSSHAPLSQVHMLGDELQNQADVIAALQKVLDLLNSMGSPPNPTPDQLKALCEDIKALNDASTRLANDPNANNDDKKMAQDITDFLTITFGANSLLSSAEAFPSSDPNATDMEQVLDGMVQDGSFSTLTSLIKNLINNPPWAPPK